mgnify:CR=1 FL=1
MKKLLALVLALVMSMSLVTISNAAYSDKADIDLKEAVDVLSAVGVFEGSDGKFDPKANLTREQAAKLVAYLQLGQKSADALVGGNKFTDVAANRWSAGYVDYCATTGVVAGIGNGQFNPTGSLTALQFGKMLLVCLGYDADSEGLTGADWQINTSKLMTSAKLLKGLDSVKATDVITREQAAQMMLNALKAPTVEYDTKGSTITINGAVIGIGGSKATYVTATVAEDSTVKNIGKTQLTNSNEYTVELGEKLFSNLKLNSTADAFMRPATKWTLKAETIGTYADTPDLTYTAGTKIGTIYSDLGLSDGISKKNVTEYVDGVYAGAFAYDIVKGSKDKVGGNGVLLNVYYNDDAETITFVEVNTYIGKVTAAYPDTTTKDAYVKIKNMDGYSCPGAGKEFETESFKKNDVVAYTYSAKDGENSIQSMALAEKVTGAMSTYTISGNVTVGGTKYDANKMSVSTVKDTVAAVDKGDDVTIYLDANGYVLYVDADADVKYAVVLNYKTRVGDLNDETKAKLLFTDGTTKTVKVALAGSLTAEDPFTNVLAPTVAESATLSQYDIVSYTIGTDDVYELTLVANARTTATASGATKLVSNGKNTFVNNIKDVNLAEANAQTTTAADAETVFLVATLKADGTVKSTAAYKGFANVPTITLADTKTTTMSVFMDAKTNNNPATVVFVLDDAGTNVTVSSNNKDIIYIKGNSSHTGAPNYTGRSYTNALGHFYEYDCFVNGDTTATTIKTESPFTKDTLIYGPSYNSKGILIDSDDSATYSTTVTSDNVVAGSEMAYRYGTDSVKNDVIKLGGASYAYAKNVEVYFIDVDGKLVAGTIDEIAYDEDDMVFVKTDDDGILTNVYIKVIDKAEEVTPGTPAVVVSTIEATADTNMIKAINVVCSDNVTSNTKVSVSLQVLNNAGTWTTLKTLTFNIAAGSKWDTAPQTVTGLAGGQYKLVCGTVEKLVTVA